MILCDIVMSREQRASATTTRRSRSTRAPISNDMQNRDEVRQHLLLVMICRILDRDEVRQQIVLIPPTMFQTAISRFRLTTVVSDGGVDEHGDEHATGEVCRKVPPPGGNNFS